MGHISKTPSSLAGEAVGRRTMPSKLADVGFVNAKEGNGGEYRLASTSKFKRTGLDRKNPGADIDAIERATAGVR
jgi:hypothetical protein